MTGEKFIPELYFKRPGFTHNAYGSFTKYRERTQKSRETGNLKHLCRNDVVYILIAKI